MPESNGLDHELNSAFQSAPHSLRMDGKVVIVTGASAGLGAHLARSLAGAGANVVITARRQDRLDAMTRALPGCLAVAGDIADHTDRQRLVSEALDAFGRVDGLVNNAATVNKAVASQESIDEFRYALEVDLVAPFALSQLVLPAMREVGAGSIVNITSTMALKALNWSPWASYAAAKSGLAGLTRELAHQWGRYNIRVNAIAPGPFSTEMSGDAFESGPVADIVRTSTSLGRAGRLGELDSTVLLLLHGASSYVTGQMIPVDGGLSITS